MHKKNTEKHKIIHQIHLYIHDFFLVHDFTIFFEVSPEPLQT